MAVGNPLIKVSVTPAVWKTADVPQLLRGIYVELRVMNNLLAEGLNVQSALDAYRNDATSVYPDVGDGD